MWKDLLKTEWFPTMWCPGCGIGGIMVQLAKVMDDLGLNHTNTVIVSGIGCTGHLGSYFNVDNIYTLHGRTLPIAEAIKIVRPELNVIVVSGDGDLTSIGGNHLLHTIRRNANLTVICNSNEVYALTGGQLGPTTPKGTPTLSSPRGSKYDPINLQNLLKTGTRYFYAKTTVYHQGHFKKCIKEAIAWEGFSFIDCTAQCIENNGRRLGFASGYQMLKWFRENYKPAPAGAESLGPHEIGILTKA